MLKHLLKACTLVALTIASCGLTWQSADAETLTFRIRSYYQYRVQVEFYSQSRRHAWPGGDQAYNLNDSRVHEYRLNCRSGEKICYGAWVTGNQNQYWGTGLRGNHSCRKCCFYCDGGITPIINLNN